MDKKLFKRTFRLWLNEAWVWPLVGLVVYAALGLTIWGTYTLGAWCWDRSSELGYSFAGALMWLGGGFCICGIVMLLLIVFKVTVGLVVLPIQEWKVARRKAEKLAAARL